MDLTLLYSEYQKGLDYNRRNVQLLFPDCSMQPDMISTSCKSEGFTLQEKEYIWKGVSLVQE